MLFSPLEQFEPIPLLVIFLGGIKLFNNKRNNYIYLYCFSFMLFFKWLFI